MSHRVFPWTYHDPLTIFALKIHDCLPDTPASGKRLLSLWLERGHIDDVVCHIPQFGRL